MLARLPSSTVQHQIPTAISVETDLPLPMVPIAEIKNQIIDVVVCTLAFHNVEQLHLLRMSQSELVYLDIVRIRCRDVPIVHRAISEMTAEETYHRLPASAVHILIKFLHLPLISPHRMPRLKLANPMEAMAPTALPVMTDAAIPITIPSRETIFTIFIYTVSFL